MASARLRGRQRMSNTANFIDPPTLMRIKSLHMRARIVVQGFLSGLHRSPHHGFSVEFSEYRQYSPGDDLRHLDWKLFARSDRYYIKRFEEETNLRCHLVVDMSRSDGLRLHLRLQQDRLRPHRRRHARLFSRDAARRRRTCSPSINKSPDVVIPARYRPGHLHRLMVALERAVAGTSTDISAPLEQVAATVRKRGMVVLISDLLAPIDMLQTRLGFLRSQGHEVVILRVLDPAELDFPFTAAATFEDMETGKDLYIDPAQARAQYRANFAKHAADLEGVCQQLGIAFHQLLERLQPLELALFDFLQSRLHAGRQVNRAGNRAARS